MDSSYYALYVALRPDHTWCLISYPYYAKYTRPRDKTFFRYIDINLNTLAQNDRGLNMIQGSVSIDDKNPNYCTVILPEMHNHIKK